MIRRRLRTDDKTWLGVVVLAVIVCAVVAIDTNWLNSRFQPGGKIVRAQFRDTGQLKKGDPVRIHGVQVGRVQGISLDHGARSATVDMLLEDDARPVYADARAEVRWRTVLGGNFAIELQRGTPSVGPLGSRPIPARHTTSQVEIEDLIAFDQAGSKQGLRLMLRELPQVFRDPAVPATTLRTLGDSAPALSTAISASRGLGEAEIPGLVRTTARTVRALDTPTGSMRNVVAGAAVTMRTMARRQADLRATLTRGAGVQPAVQTTLAQLRRTLDLAQPLIARLQRPAADVGPTLSRLQPTLVAADRLLRDARPVLTRLRPAVASLARAAGDGRPLLAALQPGMRRLGDTVLPDLAERDPVTKIRTYEMIGPVVASLDSSAATFDGDSHLFRFPAAAGQRTLSDELPCSSYFGDPESASYLRCDSLNKALQTVLSWPPPPRGRRR
jgi:phospholipid/cholesterol/gamma-HCH transport system substrate-binding protein